MITTTNEEETRNEIAPPLWRDVSFFDRAATQPMPMTHEGPKSGIDAKNNDTGAPAKEPSKETEGLIKANSPKSPPEQHDKESSSDVDELSEMIVLDEPGSSDNEGIDVSEWEPVSQTSVAVDYSNVPVFLKTLRDWRSQ